MPGSLPVMLQRVVDWGVDMWRGWEEYSQLPVGERVAIILLKLSAHLANEVRQEGVSRGLKMRDGNTKILQVMNIMDRPLRDVEHFPLPSLILGRTISHEQCLPAKTMMVANVLVERFVTVNHRENGSFTYIMDALDTHPYTVQNPAFTKVIMNMLATQWPGFQAAREAAEAERAAPRFRLRKQKLHVTCQTIEQFLIKGEKMAMRLLYNNVKDQLLAAIQSLHPDNLASLQKWAHHHCRVRGLHGPKGRHFVSQVDQTIVSELLQKLQDVLASDAIYTNRARRTHN